MGNQQVTTRSRESPIVQFPPERDGESPIYRLKASEHELTQTYDPEIRTLADVFRSTTEKYPDNKCLGTRINDGPYTWETYSEVYQRVLNFGSGLVDLGCTSHDEYVGIYSKNRAEWVIAAEACNQYSFTIVPLYDTLGEQACSYIINQTEMQTVVCTEDHTEAVLQGDTPSLKTIIQTGQLTKNNLALAKERGIELITFKGVERRGEAHALEVDPPEPDEITTICYTSGTTGDPKGVLLSHGTFIANLASLFDHGILFKPNDVHISYLPLAHMFEKIVMAAVFAFGSAAGFFRGDVTQLFDDIKLLRPSIFPSVPRLFNRLFDKVTTGANEAGGIKAMLFNEALKAKTSNLKEGFMGHSIWDKLVFSKVAEAVGGRVRLSITGSAPLSADVLNFLRVALSCPVLEGYGQTETCAAATCTLLHDTTVGHVGVPLSCCELKLVDVPEMNYTADGEKIQGEICFRGYNCTQGYFKNEEKTADLIDENGWLHTGDIGEWLPSDRLKIIDRKKNIFKLSQGEYVAPEKLENIYVKCPLLEQIFVDGNSLKSRLIAIVVPDREVVSLWLKQNGMELTYEEACETEELKQSIMEGMKEQGVQASVKGFERISDIFVSSELFSVDNDLLTPTFKLKRPQARALYRDQIDAMYEHLD